MSAHVLLNRNEFNKFNNTRARMVYLSYDIKITYFCRKNGIILSLCMQRCYERHNVVMDFITFPQKSAWCYEMVLLHSQTGHHMIK